MFATDATIIVAAVFGSIGLRFSQIPFIVPLGDMQASELPVYIAIGALIVGAWLAMLGLVQAGPTSRMGVGINEYRGVVTASILLFGLVAIVSYLTRFDLARGFVAMAFPSGLVLLVLARWFWRTWLGHQRRAGKMMMPSVVVGSVHAVRTIAKDLLRQPTAGYSVVGVCIPDPTKMPSNSKLTVLGSINEVNEIMDSLGQATLIVAGGDDLPASRIREISWKLKPGRQHLVVAPALTDIGGPRIHMRPVAGLPLIHVETPKFKGRRRLTKRLVDIALSSMAIAVLAVPLLIVALVIRLDSPGQALFRQERVGLNGNSFTMYKFRTMRADAEEVLQSLLDQQHDAGNEVLFKMKDDPRITKVGRFLRRYSIDELPQFFNVFLGNMSIVGPRPPLAREVEKYEWHVRRRFLVKPGITGLWQVSGRSNLSWDESVRLDLFYVENWSALGDIQILWKTARAVFARDGAY